MMETSDVTPTRTAIAIKPNATDGAVPLNMDALDTGAGVGVNVVGAAVNG